jgi:hypothetical protein
MKRAFALVVLASCGGAGAGAPIEALVIPSTATSVEPIASAPPTQTYQPGPKKPQVDPELRRWEGIWFDPATAYKTRMTIQIVGGVPTVVHVEEPIGDKETYEVRSSVWSGGTLEWSHYVPSTKYTVTYTCNEIRDEKLICKWKNDHSASGTQDLPRVGTAPEDDDP